MKSRKDNVWGLDKRFLIQEGKLLKDIEQFAKRDPAETQRKLLVKILKRNKNTVYGRKYKFKSILTFDDYQKQVPMVTFPDIKDSIEKIKNGKQNVLCSRKTIYFATTSGTTSEPKYIPVTRKRMRMFAKQLIMAGHMVMRKNLSAMTGKTLYFGGTDLCGYTKGGLPWGNVSGYIIKNLPPFAKRKMVLPFQVYRIGDFEERTKMIAQLALQENVTQILFAEPIEAILFFDYLKEHKEELLLHLTILGKKKLVKKLSKKEFIPIKLWPNLKVINCVKTHMNGIYLDKLIEKIGTKDIVIRDPGIYSSEAPISLGIFNDDPSGLPLINMVFFEFLEEGKDLPVTIDKVRKGKQYQLVITTQEGLYRYNLGDVVKITGFKGRVPLMRFVHRSKFIDLSGEKCPETEIVKAVKYTLEKTKTKFEHFTVVPHIESLDKRPRYEILLDTPDKFDAKKAKVFLKLFDEKLQEYVMDYENMRNEYGRLDTPMLSVLKKGSYDEFEGKRIVAKGQTKILYVSKDPDFKKNFKIEQTYKL